LLESHAHSLKAACRFETNWDWSSFRQI